MLLPNSCYMLFADNDLYQFSVRNNVNFDIFATKAYPYIIIKDEDRNKKIYFSCDKDQQKTCLSLNETLDSSIFIENADIISGDVIIKNYEMNKKQKFINLKIRDSIGDIQIIEKDNNLFFKRLDSSFPDLSKNNKQKYRIEQQFNEYNPSITIRLNINQTNADNDEHIKEMISKKIKNSYSDQFKDYNQICKKYMKNQFLNSNDKMKAINILESYYDKLVKKEEDKRKNFKTTYTLINKKLSEKLTEINNQINELEGIIEDIRKINDKIKTANREKQTLNEKIQTSTNAILSEKQMLKGDLESQSTYGIFAVRIDTQGRSFDAIDKTLQNIFENISLKALSEVFIESETEMRNGLLVTDTITSRLSGILSMTGSRDVYRGFDSNNKTLAVKMVKYTPFWEDRKGRQPNKNEETFSNWYITNQTMSEFINSIKTFFPEKDLQDIINNIDNMLQDCNNKNKICKHDRLVFIKQVSNNIDKFQKNINDNKINIDEINKKIRSYKRNKPELKIKFSKTQDRIKNSIKQFNKLDSELSKSIREGYKFNIYEFSYKPSNRKQNALQAFTELSIDMFEKVFLKSRVIHKTMETTISKGMFTKEKDNEVLLNKSFNHVSCFFDVPMTSDYPYPHYAILKVEIQVYEPEFQTHSTIISELNAEINKKTLFFDLEINGQKDNLHSNLTKYTVRENFKQITNTRKNKEKKYSKKKSQDILTKQKLNTNKNLIAINELLFSLEYFDKYSLPIYEIITKPANSPGKLASQYCIDNIKSWSLPNINELQQLYKNASNDIKSLLIGKKIYTSGKMKNNKFEYVIWENKNNQYQIGYSSRQEFVNFIFVTHDTYKQD